MDANLIFDVGLHRGEDSEFYLKKGFKVVGIEANAKLCDSVRERLATYVESGQLTIVNGAISDRPGPVTFYVNDHISEWGTTSKEWAARNERLGTKSFEVSVMGITFDDVLKRFGVPYFLKIDIEGADLLCLKALKASQTKPKYVSIESNKTSWPDLLAEFRLLKDLGYSKFKIVQQLDVSSQKCPIPALEGNYVAHDFQYGSSGMFGNEAPGQWMSEQQALRRYRGVFLRYRLFGDDGLVRRFLRLFEDKPFFWRLAKLKLRDVGWYDTHASA